MKFTLGFSPCPNDTFIFDALVNKKIDTDGFEFEVQLEDVQTLNQWALDGKLDLSKISYGVLPLILENYIVLKSGGALGKGVGPLLISKTEVEDAKTKIPKSTIAIPGKNTTAHMLFSLAFPNAEKKQFMMFNEIEDAVLSGKVDAGVIIHENRFTYQQKGLVKLMDLGEYWEKVTGLPIPLGGIVAKRSLEPAVISKVDELIKKSIEYSFANYPQLTEYVTQHAQEMEEEVMRKHIDLYVNNYSLEVGEQGKTAVAKLLEVFKFEKPVEVFID
jgi:1,4-dihydroxy-6-naphthoate synthase